LAENCLYFFYSSSKFICINYEKRVGDVQAVMAYRNQKESEQDKQVKGQGYFACQLCGRMGRAEGCSWQEDDDGLICCHDCRGERENCGCSD